MNEIYKDGKPFSKIGLFVGKGPNCAAAEVGLYENGAVLRNKSIDEELFEKSKTRKSLALFIF